MASKFTLKDAGFPTRDRMLCNGLCLLHGLGHFFMVEANSRRVIVRDDVRFINGIAVIIHQKLY